MRKFLCLILSILLCVGLFAGCGETESDHPPKKAIKREKVESSEMQMAGPSPGDPI
ncbi:secreted protein, partial [gut metagenome]